jgi:hypothetical protein
MAYGAPVMSWIMGILGGFALLLNWPDSGD